MKRPVSQLIPISQLLLDTNFYEPPAHARIAELVKGIRQYWLISYDDVPEVRILYQEYRSVGYTLHLQCPGPVPRRQGHVLV